MNSPCNKEINSGFYEFNNHPKNHPNYSYLLNNSSLNPKNIKY
jgi:hypothetical protein